MQKSPPYHVANLFNSCFRMDVTEIHGSIAQVVDSTCGCCDGRCCNRLLSQSIRDQVSIGSIEDMSIARCDTEILSGVLLLCFGDVCASVFAIVDTARWLPFGILRKLGDSFDGIADGQEMDKTDVFLSN